MKAIVLEAWGGLENLREADVPTPPPQKGQVRIRIVAAALNPVDYKVRRTGYDWPLPHILGHDAAGVIDAVGKGVAGFKEGDEVHAFLGPPRSNGSYAEYACIDEGFVAHKPASMTWMEAAALPVVGLTVYECIYRKAKPKPHSAVFVAGGAGGVGSIAIELLKHLEADPVLTTAGSDRSARYLMEKHGVTKNHILLYSGLTPDSMRDEVLKMNGGHPVPIAYDFVGGEMKRLCAAVTALEGHLVSIVEEPDDFTMGGPGWPCGALFQHSASFHSEFLLARGIMGGHREWKVYRRELEELDRLIAQGDVQAPAVTDLGKLSLATIRQGHQRLETGHTQGKLVVTV